MTTRMANDSGDQNAPPAQRRAFPIPNRQLHNGDSHQQRDHPGSLVGVHPQPQHDPARAKTQPAYLSANRAGAAKKSSPTIAEP